jgi:signal transduction histidine kinase
VKRQRLFAVLLGIIILFLIISLIFIQRYFSLRQKAAQELIKKNAEISQQKIVDLVKEQEVKSINSFMSGQEKERNRIAAELHDRLGSLLSAVKLHFSSIEADLNESGDEEREDFSFALKLLDNSVDEVRTISHNLSKGILMQFGLSEAIKNLRDTINTAGQLQIKFIEAGPGFNLNPEVEVELFRITQELITNAIKHSQADEIFVQLISDEEGLRIVVEDNGVGFDMRKLKEKGIGLLNLKSRVEKINGEYHIESSVGNGTNIIIEVKNSNL